MLVCVSRSSQPRRWLPVGAITNAGTTDVCAQISVVEPTWLSELIDKESGWPQLWKLLQTEQSSLSGPELSRGYRVQRGCCKYPQKGECMGPYRSCVCTA